MCVFTNLRQTVQLHGALHCHVPAQVGELHLDQFAGVQRAMPVPVQQSRNDIMKQKGGVCVCMQPLENNFLSHPPACAHRFGQYHSSGINRLKDPLQVNPSGDLSDENRSDSFGAKLLVHAEEINLNHFLFSKTQEQ